MPSDQKSGDPAQPGTQGLLFERPPQTSECKAMKPPRRLGKGLAALVDLHSSSGGAPATDDPNEQIGSSVLHLLSTTAEELADSRAAALGGARFRSPSPSRIRSGSRSPNR